MKAISIKQPWAWLIFHGKPVENRTWPSKYRGPLLIHASKNFDFDGYRWLRLSMPKVFNSISNDLFRGFIIGQVNMIDCVTEHSSEFFFGPYGHVYENPIEFNSPIPWNGQQGIFNVPDEIICL